MKPLLDGDIFLYEIGACAHYTDDEGEEQIRSFDFVQGLLEDRIAEICEAVGATAPPTIFFTGKGNFRFEVAKTKPYKGNRKDVEKPFHHANILIYLQSAYECITAEDCEADDELAMAQMEVYRVESIIYDLNSKLENFNFDRIEYLKDNCETVICTRDKDLRMVPGWNYSWECGRQPESPIQWIDDLGGLFSTYKTKLNKKGEEVMVFDKLIGTGLRWFYAQLLMGDNTDNIPGCPGIGPKKAYEALKEDATEMALFETVCWFYCDKYEEEEWLERLKEQAYLLWMVRERDEEGKLIMWRIPE